MASPDPLGGLEQSVKRMPYEKWLRMLMDVLQQLMYDFFPDHPCRKGRGDCCRDHHEPLLITPFDAHDVRTGFVMLSGPDREIVTQRAIQANSGELHECPFLLNGQCSIYTRRPLMCRLAGTGLVQMSNQQGSGAQPVGCDFCAKAIKARGAVYHSKIVEYYTATLVWLTQHSKHRITDVVLNTWKK